MRVCEKEENPSLVTDPTADTLSPYRVERSGPSRYAATQIRRARFGEPILAE